jgi:hypothetical protein
MSADAKAWYDEDGRDWHGCHDGPCAADAIPHDQADTLVLLLSGIEWCMNASLRWEIRVYPDGKAGLVGWVA